MKKLSTLLLLLICINAFSAELYSKSFGNPEHPALIFLHGGPGYNAASFEATTAQTLAESGFYVIIYDRRGEGRSKNASAKFNFKESFKDLKSLYEQYNIESASLIGHSFGGILGTKFSNKYPKLVKNLILVGAPISLQESFKTIISSSKKIYTDNNDKTNLKYLNMLDDMDSESLEYAVYCFSHAMQNGFYTPDSLSAEAKQIYTVFRADSTLAKYAAEMTQAATQGFWKNESYTSINLEDELQDLVENNIQVYGLYGKEDGLYSKNQIDGLTEILGEDQLLYLDNCSHSVYIDQQKIFIEALRQWILEE